MTIKTVSKLNISDFTQSEKCVSIGRIRSDIAASITEHFPELKGKISPDFDILFWSDRVKHTERHRKDFSSSEEFDHCFSCIPDIVRNPDYISVHPSMDSISFIKDFADHTSVAIRVSSDGRLAFRTMYPLRRSQLEKYIKNGYAWEFE